MFSTNLLPTRTQIHQERNLVNLCPCGLILRSSKQHLSSRQIGSKDFLHKKNFQMNFSKPISIIQTDSKITIYQQ